MVAQSPQRASLIASLCAALLLCVASATLVDAQLETTQHNLGVSGPAATPPAGEDQGALAKRLRTDNVGLCVFCHTPHNARPTAGLWNRQAPATTYRLYESSTLEAEPTQPNGTSRLCLSCHDGTLALGALRVQPAAGRISLPALRGRASLGTDLSDDHPISFVYDHTLAGQSGELVDPATLPGAVALDEAGRMQCTSCHDAHEDKYGKFLVMDNAAGRLCSTCHRLKGWQESAHATSSAPLRTVRGTRARSVGEAGCANCHRQHGALHPEWLLAHRDESEGCMGCHDGTVAARDVVREFRAPSAHPVEVAVGRHAPGEDPLFMPRHVACGDCHDPHSARSVFPGVAVTSSGRRATTMDSIGFVEGVDSAGGSVRAARAEAEVCYKCHGVQDETDFIITRDDNVTNTRVELSPGNASFHPVESVGRNRMIEGLEAGYTASSILSCSDCHGGSQTGTTAGIQPSGPHGSIYKPILVREYRMTDPSRESFQSYSLCYDCHNRSALLSPTADFPHRLHVVDAQASCAVCHDAHGSRENSFLINFMTRDETGNEIVRKSASGRLEFISSGRNKGQCSLSCHGSNHDPSVYPPLPAAIPRVVRPTLDKRPPRHGVP